MSFTNGILLGGAALILVPILLHLMMRRQPKHLLFPALRLVKRRQLSNRRRMQLRHVLLLAVRCAALLLLVLALARPSVRPGAIGPMLAALAVTGLGGLAALGLLLAWAYQARRAVLAGLAAATLLLLVFASVLALRWLGDGEATLGGQAGPVAAALVFDTGVRMEYLHQNQTRLDAARALGERIVAQLPADSEVAVLDSRSARSLDAGDALANFAVDHAMARRRITSLQTTAVPLPLPHAVRQGIDRVLQSDKARQEVYVLTDLARVAWDEHAAKELRQRMEEAPQVHVYVIDVGAAQPRNFALGDVVRFDDVLPAGDRAGAPAAGRLTLAVDVLHTGDGGTCDVELRMYDDSDASAGAKPDERPSRIRGTPQSVQLAANGSQRVEFSLDGLREGVQQGFIQLTAVDGLPVDDRRYFTVRVRPAWRVLLVAPDPPDDYARFVLQAVQPAGMIAAPQFDCETMRLADLDRRTVEDLQQYAAVCLLDPEPLSAAAWTLLSDYVRHGGGVGLMLGRNVRFPERFAGPASRQLLPGQLQRIQNRQDDPTYLVETSASHPVLTKVRGTNQDVPWYAWPVYKYWQIDLPERRPDGNDVDQGRAAHPVMRFSTGHPAVIAATLGSGRIVVTATPVSDWPSDPRTWNLLTANNPWPYMALLDGTLLYLAGAGAERLNYFAGQPATLQVDPALRSVSGINPLGNPLPAAVDPRQSRLVVSSTQWPGSYVLRAGGEQDPFRAGFSVNIPADLTRLERITTEDLQHLLGEGTFTLAQTPDEIVREVAQRREGVKLFPWLMLALAVAMAAEHLLSSFFYRPRKEDEP
jgi:hypothetical protein